jgi:hypothetical protein
VSQKKCGVSATSCGLFSLVTLMDGLKRKEGILRKYFGPADTTFLTIPSTQPLIGSSVEERLYGKRPNDQEIVILGIIINKESP